MKLPLTLDTPVGKLTYEGKLKDEVVYRGGVRLMDVEIYRTHDVEVHADMQLSSVAVYSGRKDYPAPEWFLIEARKVVLKYLQELDKAALMPKVSPIIPRADNVLLRQVREDEVTPGGVIIPDDARDRTFRGEVVAVGPGRPLPDGKYLPLDLSEGDEVIYARFSGIRLELEGDEYILVSERDIHGKVRKGVEA